MESTDFGMPGAVQGGEAQVNTGTFHGQLGAAAARGAGIDGFQPSPPVGVVLVGLHLPDGVMPMHGSSTLPSSLARVPNVASCLPPRSHAALARCTARTTSCSPV